MRKQKQSPPLRTLYSSHALQLMPEPQEKPKYRGMAMSVEDMAEELAIGRNVAYELVLLTIHDFVIQSLFRFHCPS